MATLAQFVRNIARRGKQVEDGTERILQKTFIAVGSAVVPATPVDTGRARGAWLSGRTVTPTGENPPDAGATAVAQNRAVGTSLKIQDTGVIVNNVPYIGRLNEGSSKQAPAQFVQKAVQTAIRTVRSARILNR